MNNEYTKSVVLQLRAAYLVEALGDLAFDGLDNCKLQNFTHEESWRFGIYSIAKSAQVFCQSIAQQIAIDGVEAHTINRSLAFQIEAVGESAVNSLGVETIQMTGGSSQQRVYVEGVALSIKAFCDSISEQLRPLSPTEVSQ